MGNLSLVYVKIVSAGSAEMDAITLHGARW